MQILFDEIYASNDGKPATAHTITETNWYFYGNAVSQDAIGDNVRSTIMVREKAGKFTTNFSISDHDFAVNIDAILSFKADFENHLARL